MKPENTYQSCLEAMYGLRRFGIHLGLSTIRQLLRELGDPQDAFSCIHVAGTNGKGSVASSLSSILSEAGFRVGLYTSPHLVSFNERIKIDNRPISDDEVIEACHAVRSIRTEEREPTFFEYTTAMAFWKFGRAKIDWAVIETGMGGRLDATNIIVPAVSIITNVSLEHQMYLGSTLGRIAREKGGIIKAKIPVITGAKQRPVLDVLYEIGREKSSPVYRIGKDFRVRRRKNGAFSYFGLANNWEAKTLLQGDHQIDNAALALAACELLNIKGIEIHFERIEAGLSKTVWPGRLETVRQSPLTLLDGAHNLNAAHALAKYINAHLSGKNITFVIGILNDKDYRGMLKSLLPYAGRVILTQACIDRALPPETLYPAAREMLHDVKIIPEVAGAVKYAVETSGPDDVVCIAGSLYVVGEARAALMKGP